MAEKLVAIADVTRLTPRLVRILGQNPGSYTLQGTNTYLISAPTVAFEPVASILFDTGEGKEEYIPILERVLRGDESTAGDAPGSGPKRWISDIILSHQHYDHTGGLADVLKLCSKLRGEASFSAVARPPRIHKFPHETDTDILEKLSELPTDSWTSHDDTGTLWPLADGDELRLPSEAKTDFDQSTTLKTVHSPGHTADHVSFILLQERALFSGDNVLGQGTSVFEDLGVYLQSLNKYTRQFEALGPSPNVQWTEADFSSSNENIIYPSHGPALDKGRQTITTYVRHRLEREAQVVQLLSQPSPTQEKHSDTGTYAWSLRDIVAELYKSYPEHLHLPASRGIFLHLLKLMSPDPDAKQSTTPTVVCLDPKAYDTKRPVKMDGLLEALEWKWALSRDPAVPETQRL